MFIIKLGSTFSIQTSNMPPHKKLKTDVDESAHMKSITSESESESADFGSDWRERCQSLSDKYNYVMRNNVLTDVKLIVGEEQAVFHCHRLILALGSPVFEAMFFGQLAETGDTVVIPDIDPEGFKNLIRALYTGQYLLQNDEVAFKTYFAADKYCVCELKKYCESYLCRSELDPSNVWLFFENSLFLNSQAIKKRCQNILKLFDLKSCLEQKSFLDIHHNTMEALLGLDDLNGSEETILKNVLRWADHRSKQTEGETDSFANLLKPLLASIRFGALTAEGFVDLRHSTRLNEVVSDEDCLLILEHLVDPALCQLPDWCCTKTRGLEIKPLKIRRGKSKQFKSGFCSSSITTSSSSSSSDSSTSTSYTSD